MIQVWKGFAAIPTPQFAMINDIKNHHVTNDPDVTGGMQSINNPTAFTTYPAATYGFRFPYLNSVLSANALTINSVMDTARKLNPLLLRYHT